MTPAALKQAVLARARTEGFGIVRVTTPSAIPDAARRLRQWLDASYHGTMDWMADRADWRGDPARLWPEARSVIMLGLSYTPPHDPLAVLAEPEKAALSVYAARRDYHDVIKGKLKTVAGALTASDAAIKVFVDTAPVMEKALAEAAGLGWQGKHTVLVSREHGSWLFLGAIFTSAELPADEAGTDHCGRCTRCLDICPTKAFPAPYVLDARRCVAYLTIEHAGHIDRDLRPGIGNRVFGCDDCLAICPWNKFADAARESRLALREDLLGMPLSALAALGDASFRRLFAGTPVKRTGRDRFVRNVLIAIGNSDAAELGDVAQARLDDASPLVRAMAVWALARLAPGRARELAAGLAQMETDTAVQAEWRTVLDGAA
ncbi:MAG: tRNA epoxyqueuosine(34) reductase QueG [Hyphomicrobiales bacterium]|nr:tRNA epoxyqueuosine(34) reductase QueG [Hyphomicrobiales bacterium]